MGHYYLLAFFYLLTALLPAVIGIFRRKRFDTATKIFWAMLILSAVTELAALPVAVIYKNNTAVYNIDSIVEMGLVALYFTYCIEAFSKYHSGMLITGISVAIGILTLILTGSLLKINNYFMVYQGLAVICMSLSYLTQHLIKYPLMRWPYTPHFWFATLLVFYWTLTLLNWAMYDYLTVRFGAYAFLLNLAIMFIAMITYLGFAATFFFYPKMTRDFD